MSKGGYTPYPVVDADPSIGTSVMNFSLGEMMTIPVFTGGSMAYGYFLSRKSMRIPCVRACGFIGFTTAFLGAYASSSQRLMGFDPNSEEVAMYGALTPKEATDFEYYDTYTNSESLDSSDRKSRAS